MSQACSVCNHDKVKDINRAIVSGKSKASISRKYGVSSDALRNHAENHISRQNRLSSEIIAQKEAVSLYDEVNSLITSHKEKMDQADKKRQNGLYLAFSKELRQSLETRAKFEFAAMQAKKDGLSLSEDAIEQRNLEKDMQVRMLRNMSNLSSYEHKIHAGILAKLMDGDKNKIIGLIYPNESIASNNTSQEETVSKTAPMTRTKSAKTDEPEDEQWCAGPVPGIPITWTKKIQPGDLPDWRR